MIKIIGGFRPWVRRYYWHSPIYNSKDFLSEANEKIVTINWYLFVAYCFKKCLRKYMNCYTLKMKIDKYFPNSYDIVYLNYLRLFFKLKASPTEVSEQSPYKSKVRIQLIGYLSAMQYDHSEGLFYYFLELYSLHANIYGQITDLDCMAIDCMLMTIDRMYRICTLPILRPDYPIANECINRLYYIFKDTYNHYIYKTVVVLKSMKSRMNKYTKLAFIYEFYTHTSKFKDKELGYLTKKIVYKQCLPFLNFLINCIEFGEFVLACAPLRKKEIYNEFCNAKIENILIVLDTASKNTYWSLYEQFIFIELLNRLYKLTYSTYTFLSLRKIDENILKKTTYLKQLLYETLSSQLPLSYNFNVYHLGEYVTFMLGFKMRMNCYHTIRYFKYIVGNLFTQEYFRILVSKEVVLGMIYLSKMMDCYNLARKIYINYFKNTPAHIQPKLVDLLADIEKNSVKYDYDMHIYDFFELVTIKYKLIDLDLEEIAITELYKNNLLALQYGLMASNPYGKDILLSIMCKFNMASANSLNSINGWPAV